MNKMPLLRSREMIEAYNKSVDDGTIVDDPRFYSNHPLHDIVCGWCGKIHGAKDATDD